MTALQKMALNTAIDMIRRGKDKHNESQKAGNAVNESIRLAVEGNNLLDDARAWIKAVLNEDGE